MGECNKNEQQSNIKAVTTPLIFAKKDFSEFLEEEKKNVPEKAQFGSDYITKIPSNVNEPLLKKELFFLNNATYCYSVVKKKSTFLTVKKIANCIPHKVDLQMLISNNRTQEKPVATIGIVFQLESGELSKPVMLDSGAKSRYANFVLAVNKSNNRLSFNLDDESFLLLMEKINQQKAETTFILKNAGKVKFLGLEGRAYSNAYVDKNVVIPANEDGLIKVGGHLITLDDSVRDRLPEFCLEDIDVKLLLNNFFTKAEKIYKGRLDVLLAIGASVMTVFLDEIWEKRAGFPICYLYGATKQGKSILQGIISNIFGYSNKNVSMGNSTDNAIAMKCHRANAIPILINDFDVYKAQGNAFENNIVQFYEGGVREKMYDGSVMNRMPINTTANFSSNYMPANKPKIFNRLLTIYFPENGIAKECIDDKFVNDRSRSRIIAEMLKYDTKYVLEFIDEIEKWILQSKFLISKDRESNNIAIAYTGLLLLEQIAGYKLEEQEEKLQEYCKWYETLFETENEPIERFLRAFPKLINSAKFKKGVHYHTEIKDMKFLLTFDFANCIAIYNEEFVSNGEFSKYIDRRTFGADIKNSVYFVARRNHRFNNAKGQAYAYTLDVTSNEIARYIDDWGMQIDKMQKEAETQNTEDSTSHVQQ